MSRSTRIPRRAKPSADAREAGEAGFALIEILVAFTIALLALGALYEASSSGLGVAAAAAGYSRALLLAESALDEAGVSAPLKAGTSTSRLAGGYDRNVTVRPRPDLLHGAAAIPSAYPYEVSVSVSWRDAGRVRAVDLSTIRLGQLP